MTGNRPSTQKPNGEDENRTAGPLPGQPGYRTRGGRSGLDPVDSGIEGGHMAGVSLQRFFAVRMRVTKPSHLYALALFGLIMLLPIILAVIETVRGNPMPAEGWFFFAVLAVIGLFALANLVKNLKSSAR